MTHLAAKQFTDMYADSKQDKRNVAVVSAGRGAENSLIGPAQLLLL